MSPIVFGVEPFGPPEVLEQVTASPAQSSILAAAIRVERGE
jgi:hypothetical protein